MINFQMCAKDCAALCVSSCSRRASPNSSSLSLGTSDIPSLTDLGTLGGSFAIANGINDSGEVVGWATNKNDQASLAFLWKKGVITGLGTLNGDDCSVAFHINSQGSGCGQFLSVCWRSRAPVSLAERLYDELE